MRLKLKELRTKNNLSVADMAIKLGVSTSYLHIPAHPDGYSGFIRTVNRSIRTPCL